MLICKCNAGAAAVVCSSSGSGSSSSNYTLMAVVIFSMRTLCVEVLAVRALLHSYTTTLRSAHIYTRIYNQSIHCVIVHLCVLFVFMHPWYSLDAQKISAVLNIEKRRTISAAAAAAAKI